MVVLSFIISFLLGAALSIFGLSLFISIFYFGVNIFIFVFFYFVLIALWWSL